MNLSGGTLRERHDIGRAPFAKLSDRPNKGSREQTCRALFKGNLMLTVLGNDENKLAANFNLGRRSPEIAITHTCSSSVSIRLPEECDSFVLNGNLTQISDRATAHCASAEAVTPMVASAFSIARTG